MTPEPLKPPAEALAERLYSLLKAAAGSGFVIGTTRSVAMDGEFDLIKIAEALLEMPEPEPLKPAIDSWDITGPDQEGRVWMNVDENGSFTMIDLGQLADVREKVMDWLEAFDPE